jgi:Protein of unknown function (DUF4231)
LAELAHAALEATLAAARTDRAGSLTAGIQGDEPDTGYARLEGQIAWYDSRSGSAQRWFKTAKVTEIVCAAAVSVIAHFSAVAVSILGGAILLLEGLQHLNQWQHNWITYRATCEALRHEKYTYLARSGPYDDLPDAAARKLLAERVEGLISTEHSKWITNQETAAQRLAKSQPGKGS